MRLQEAAQRVLRNFVNKELTPIIHPMQVRLSPADEDFDRVVGRWTVTETIPLLRLEGVDKDMRFYYWRAIESFINGAFLSMRDHSYRLVPACDKGIAGLRFAVNSATANEFEYKVPEYLTTILSVYSSSIKNGWVEDEGSFTHPDLSIRVIDGVMSRCSEWNADNGLLKHLITALVAAEYDMRRDETSKIGKVPMATIIPYDDGPDGYMMAVAEMIENLLSTDRVNGKPAVRVNPALKDLLVARLGINFPEQGKGALAR